MSSRPSLALDDKRSNSSPDAREDEIDNAPLTEAQKDAVAAGPREPPRFTFKSLFQPPVINPLNLKSYTLPIFNPFNRYTIAFHLAWLGFFVAFLSWFAFPPLIPEAIRTDLRLTQVDIANSNIVALCATLLTRFITGPAVDRFGPRLVMASILFIGAIPSGLAGTAHNAGSLMTIRFFIGILGGSFVPCVAWTTAFFDKSVVGTANALVTGWGNMGGGVTFDVMVGLYSSLTGSRGLTPHVAWRVAFVIVPVPILFFMSAMIFVLGSDHPAGKWSQRHTTAATAVAIAQGHSITLDHSEKAKIENKLHDKEAGTVKVEPATDEEETQVAAAHVTSTVDVAVNEALTLKTLGKILFTPQTWLPALMYMSTFGYELFYDSNFNATLFAIYNTRGRDTTFSQTTAGYYTSIFGLLNLVTRPLGGIGADLLYRRYGVRVKKWMTVCFGLSMGLFSVGMGVYIDNRTQTAGDNPRLGVLIVFSIIIAFCCEIANGSNYALVPHCSPYSNGTVSGIVGGCGNLGGIWFALVYRYQNTARKLGRPYWIVGTVCACLNAIVAFIPSPEN